MKKSLDPSNLIISCQRCRQLYLLYIPHKLEAKELNYSPKEIVKAEKFDDEEKKAGIREHLKNVAKTMKAKFIDMSVLEILQCDCGITFDPLADYYRQSRERQSK